jgi:prepilin-type N-terminal cleavage/methylation domain-containing protein
LQRRWKSDDGFGLVELLIAMTVLVVGISGIVAAFSSGMVALRNASRVSAAGAVADKKMETFRAQTFAAIAAGTTTSSPVGPDGRTYWVQVVVVDNTCDAQQAGWTLDTTVTPAVCREGTVAVSRPVKLVTIVVRDGSSTARLLFRESSTFDASTG